MAAKRLNQLKRQLERLRTDSVNVVSTANKIVYGGVQKLADRELRALNEYYRSALASVRSARRSDGIRGLAQKQLDLLQETVNQVIGNARESMAIVAQTRAELADFVQKSIRGEKVPAAGLAKAAAPARKAVAKTKTAARKATRSAAKSTGKAKAKAAKKTGTGARKPAKKARFVSAAAESRAGRAASAAKRVARKAADTLSQAAASATQGVEQAVSSVTQAVTEAVKSND
jgi:hypothetical protein